MTADWLKAFPDAKIPQFGSRYEIKEPYSDRTVQRYVTSPYRHDDEGVIWYQGEDNWNRAHTYADMFTALINGWRSEWKQGDFPFYYCQIAPYDYGIITEKVKK